MISAILCVTLDGQILGRWVFVVDGTRGVHERYEKHWVCHIAMSLLRAFLSGDDHLERS